MNAFLLQAAMCFIFVIPMLLLFAFFCSALFVLFADLVLSKFFKIKLSAKKIRYAIILLTLSIFFFLLGILLYNFGKDGLN